MKIFVLALLLFVGSTHASDKTESPGCKPHPAVQEMLDKLKTAGNPLDTMSAQSVGGLWFKRERDARMTIAPLYVASVKDVAIPARNYQIPVRIYSLAGHAAKLPILVYYHGGGFTLGSLATYDSLARELARKIPAIVVLVDYRLAPEHPFPAAVEDSYLALEWVARNLTDLGGDPEKLILAGDSAGANLAAVMARRAHQENLKVALQVLLYPTTDFGHLDYPSYEKFGKGYLLTKKSVIDFRGFYLPNSADWENADAAPFRAKPEELKGQAPALMMLVGCDPLQDEGMAYAEKLRAQDVKVKVEWVPSMVHGFLGFFNNAAEPKVAAAVTPIVADLATKIRLMLKK